MFRKKVTELFSKKIMGGPKPQGGPWTRESPGGIARGGRALQDVEKMSALPRT